jgi:four helix bundle protein
MKDFRTLKVWEKSHLLVLAIYKVSKGFPKEEAYGLTSQLKRATASIAINLAEGCGRGSDADFKRFVQIAMGSASETEYLLLLSKDLGYIDEETYCTHAPEIEEIKKMLVSLLSRLGTNNK